MGCVCSGEGESSMESFLKDFIEELNIRKYTEKSFFSFLDKYCPFLLLRTNYEEFLRSNQNLEIHRIYQENLLKSNPFYFYASLVFLLNNQNPRTLEGSYRQILSKLKKSYLEREREILEDVLFFYCKMVTLDIIEAGISILQRGNKIGLAEEKVKILKNYYNEENIKFYVMELFRLYYQKIPNKNPNSNSNEINLMEFFTANFANLSYPIVQENLKKIYLEKGPIQKEEKIKPENEEDLELVCSGNPGDMEEGKNEEIPEAEMYKFVLPNIEYRGYSGDLREENYGRNNYEDVLKKENEVEDYVRNFEEFVDGNGERI